MIVFICDHLKFDGRSANVIFKKACNIYNGLQNHNP